MQTSAEGLKPQAKPRGCVASALLLIVICDQPVTSMRSKKQLDQLSQLRQVVATGSMAGVLAHVFGTCTTVLYAMQSQVIPICSKAERYPLK